MSVELKIPEVGESITEVQIGEWLKSKGDRADQDEPLVVIETDKVTVELPAPVAGKITKVLKSAGDTAEVGEVIGYMEEGSAEGGGDGGDEDKDGAASTGSAKKASKKASKKKAAKKKTRKKAKVGAEEDSEDEGAEAEDEAEDVEEEGEEDSGDEGEGDAAEAADEDEDAAPEREDRDVFVMPAARRALADHDLDPADVTATGPGGRMLKEDVQRALGEKGAKKRPAPAAPRSATEDTEEDVVPMSPMRKRIAQRLVEAQQTAALLTTFNEIDMSAVIALRKRHQDRFVEQHEVKLGFMSFFVKAAVEALKLVPAVNAEVRGTDIVYRNAFHVGIAVGGGKGLVVPVLRHAERLGFAEIEKTIGELAKRAQASKLELSELLGGTFTISNGGIYGSLLSTPIVNPPQSGILGLHAIQDRPVAIDGQVVVRPMMYVALTYDHRIVDGREAVTFLKRIKECVEDPARILLEA